MVFNINVDIMSNKYIAKHDFVIERYFHLLEMPSIAKIDVRYSSEITI
jgi:hypothetical protein